MAGIELIRSFLEQASAQGSKSTVLNPLGWLIATLSALLLGLIWAHAPGWLIAGGSIAVGVFLLLYMAAYLYFMLKDPDALRSEKFKLSKMALERSITGDSLQGFTGEGKEVVKLLPMADESTDLESD